MSEVQAPNNAAVEMQRRQSVVNARNNAEGADKTHRENVPKPDVTRNMTMHPTRMQLAEYDRQEWIANAEVGHTIDDVLKPSYWAHMSSQMQPYDHIEVRAEDGSWIADLIVMEPGRNYAKVVLKFSYEIPNLDNISDSNEHTVAWKGPQRKYTVIRLADQEYVRDGFKTREEAGSWLREHERTLGT